MGMSLDRSLDSAVRVQVFDWLDRAIEIHGPVLARALLVAGLEINGTRVPLMSPRQGIFKPRVLDLPLSIATTPGGPYDDAIGPGGLLRYRYRGTDPTHRDNIGLREAMAARVPLIYFHGLAPGRYLATWPVFIARDDPASLTFSVAVDDRRLSDHATITENDEARRAYVTSITLRRLHQQVFRERVLSAYRRQCAFCRLRHEELLDAAHIVPDSEPEGEPTVSNGLSLCTLHHKAFDRFFIGLRPDYVLEVRPDILRETDGPTLVYAIQKLHGSEIVVPSRKQERPDLMLVEKRYEEFRASSA